MNYHHSYHAGSFTDVIKHIVLAALIQSFERKENAFCYVDTHAGAGYYDLSAASAAKNKEFTTGIEKVLHQANPPVLVQHYLQCVQRMNQQLAPTSTTLRYYPGSPFIARYLARPQDKLILCELHEKVYQALKSSFLHDKQVATHHMDGFAALKAYLPPVEKRGLILIDPPYEKNDEFAQIVNHLHMALKRFATGVYAVWYPIKEKSQLNYFYRLVKEKIAQETYIIEFTIYSDLPQRLNGCGMLIINPPWQLHVSIDEVLPWLWQCLTIDQQGGYQTFMLE